MYVLIPLLYSEANLVFIHAQQVQKAKIDAYNIPTISFSFLDYFSTMLPSFDITAWDL